MSDKHSLDDGSVEEYGQDGRKVAVHAPLTWDEFISRMKEQNGQRSEENRKRDHYEDLRGHTTSGDHPGVAQPSVNYLDPSAHLQDIVRSEFKYCADLLAGIMLADTLTAGQTRTDPDSIRLNRETLARITAVCKIIKRFPDVDFGKDVSSMERSAARFSAQLDHLENRC